MGDAVEKAGATGVGGGAGRVGVLFWVFDSVDSCRNWSTKAPAADSKAV